MDVGLFKKRLLEISNGEKQKEIAEKLNISESTLSKILAGTKEPTVTDLLHIAQVYNCSIDYLLGVDDCTTQKTYRDFAKMIAEYSQAFDITLFSFGTHSHNDDFKIDIRWHYGEPYRDAMQSLIDFAINMFNLHELLSDTSLSEMEAKEVYQTMAQKYVSKVSNAPLPYSFDGWKYDPDWVDELTEK